MMVKLSRLFLLVLVLFMLVILPGAKSCSAQTHSVTLTWTDTLNPATGTTYNVYRATGLCTGTPTFAKVASGVAAKTFSDTTVTPGGYCYQVTAVVAGVESNPSNSVNPTVPAFAPTGLAAVVQ